jgi:hypothetical protein
LGKSNFTAKELQTLFLTPLFTLFVEFLSSDTPENHASPLIQRWRSDDVTFPSKFLAFNPLVISSHLHSISHNQLGYYIAHLLHKYVKIAKDQKLEECFQLIQKTFVPLMGTIKSHVMMFRPETAEKELDQSRPLKGKMKDDLESEIASILSSGSLEESLTSHVSKLLSDEDCRSLRAVGGCFPSDIHPIWNERGKIKYIPIFGDVFAYLSTSRFLFFPFCVASL